MQVRTSDGKGTIFVDGVAKGEGAYAADVTPGPHTVVVTREGFQRYEKAISLAERQTWAETVTLDPVAATGAVATEGERGLEGIYGGFGLFGASGVGGMGTELATDCANLGASSCSTPSPLGGGAFGYVGYSWNPVGFELMLGGEGDTVKQTGGDVHGHDQRAHRLRPAPHRDVRLRALRRRRGRPRARHVPDALRPRDRRGRHRPVLPPDAHGALRPSRRRIPSLHRQVRSWAAWATSRPRSPPRRRCKSASRRRWRSPRACFSGPTTRASPARTSRRPASRRS